MAYLDHVATCNAHDLAKFRRFLIDGSPVGWVRHDTARRLGRYPEVFVVGDDRVTLHSSLSSPDARSRAVEEVGARMHEDWGTPALRGERYQVAGRWGGTGLMTIDRGLVSLFGVQAYGIHINGVVRRPEGPFLWIGRRAPDKAVAPGKLDNMVAGGPPVGLSLMGNLLKEAAEEADMPAALAANARPVGAVSYCMEDAWGLKPDTMFCFDLEVPETFSPRNTDGEMAEFLLMPVDDVRRRVRDTDDFKFNVNLVILDFLIRHGVLHPDTEPDFLEIASGLRRVC